LTKKLGQGELMFRLNGILMGSPQFEVQAQ